MLTAEVVPIPEKNVVALALQRQGFKVLSIGETITIGGELSLFEKFFAIKMERHSKDGLLGAKIEFYKPATSPLIPDEFKSLIKEVLFPEPPEYFKN